MSYNARVTDQVNKMAQAYGTPAYTAEKEAYWKIIEEEAIKDGDRAWGWLAYEDATDILEEAIANEDDKDWIGEILADYERFTEMLVRVFGDEGHRWYDRDLVQQAEEYIA